MGFVSENHTWQISKLFGGSNKGKSVAMDVINTTQYPEGFNKLPLKLRVH